MKKSFFNTLMACIVIALCTVLFCTIISNAYSQPEIIDYEEYIVERGDTLWVIAAQSNGYDFMDTRKIINDIEEESGCSAYIYPGQIVYIPIYDI
jgi:hypothetical protein